MKPSMSSTSVFKVILCALQRQPLPIPQFTTILKDTHCQFLRSILEINFSLNQTGAASPSESFNRSGDRNKCSS